MLQQKVGIFLRSTFFANTNLTVIQICISNLYDDIAPCFLSSQIADSDIYAQNLRRAVREAVLSGPLSNSEISDDNTTNAGSENFFIPRFIDVPQKEVGVVRSQRKQHLFSSLGSEDSLEQVLSPPYLKDEPVFDDCYEDLLGMPIKIQLL